MSFTSEGLLGRILRFDVDGRPAEVTFAMRLARENQWSLDFADRVILEYKRFLYLATTAGHAVTPSKQVDQAWHLHLTYTRSYWDRLCRDTLGRALHHDPTTGGAAETAKFWIGYQRTLDSYRLAFGDDPPADIWPAHVERLRRRQNAVLPYEIAARTSSAGTRGARRRTVPLLAAWLLLLTLAVGAADGALPDACLGSLPVVLVLGAVTLVWLLAILRRGASRNRGSKYGKSASTTASASCGTVGCGPFGRPHSDDPDPSDGGNAAADSAGVDGGCSGGD